MTLIQTFKQDYRYKITPGGSDSIYVGPPLLISNLRCDNPRYLEAMGLNEHDQYRLSTRGGTTRELTINGQIISHRDISGIVLSFRADQTITYSLENDEYSELRSSLARFPKEADPKSIELIKDQSPAHPKTSPNMIVGLASYVRDLLDGKDPDGDLNVDK